VVVERLQSPEPPQGLSQPNSVAQHSHNLTLPSWPSLCPQLGSELSPQLFSPVLPPQHTSNVFPQPWSVMPPHTASCVPSQSCTNGVAPMPPHTIPCQQSPGVPVQQDVMPNQPMPVQCFTLPSHQTCFTSSQPFAMSVMSLPPPYTSTGNGSTITTPTWPYVAPSPVNNLTAAAGNSLATSLVSELFS